MVVARQLQHYGDVVDGIEKGKQVVRLEDEADLVQPQASQVDAQPSLIEDDLALEAHGAFRGIQDAGDHVQERGLARAGGAEQGHDLARRDVDRNLSQCVDARFARSEVLGDASQADEWLWTRGQVHAQPPRAVAGSALSAARTPRPLARMQTMKTTPPSASTLSGSSTTRRGK